MSTSRAVAVMQGEAPVPIESRALGTLAYIRASIESSSSMAVPGMAGVSMGAIGVLAAVLAALPELAPHRLAIWLGAAVIALGVGGTLMARKAARGGSARYLGPARKFLVCLCPALLAGAVLTLVLWRAGSERVIPGVWLLLYGCSVLSASTVTSAAVNRLVGAMGISFAALALVAFSAPATVQTLLLGLGFGGLHILFGILVGRASRDEAHGQ
jgi:hypothetical protein